MVSFNNFKGNFSEQLGFAADDGVDRRVWPISCVLQFHNHSLHRRVLTAKAIMETLELGFMKTLDEMTPRNQGNDSSIIQSWLYFPTF